MRPWRFLLLNLVSALSWTLCFSCLGCFFGGWVVDHLGAVKGLQVVVLGVVVTRQVQRCLGDS